MSKDKEIHNIQSKLDNLYISIDNAIRLPIDLPVDYIKNILADCKVKIEAIYKELGTIEVKQDWILVSDRLPERNKRVLVTMSCEEGLLVVVTNYNKYNNKFMWLSNLGDRIDIADTVTAWKEMPEPWKGV